MVNTWKEALEISKIPRVNYKAILKESLTSYLLKRKYVSNEELLKELLLILRRPENKVHLNGIGLAKVGENLRISLSARRAEQRIYGK